MFGPVVLLGDVGAFSENSPDSYLLDIMSMVISVERPAARRSAELTH